MKKTLMALCAVLACAVVSAQEAAPAPAPVVAKAPDTKAPWPVWLAFNSIEDIDVIGLRLTLPYGECESVTGFDLGVYGRCRYFEGLQANILRNEALDVMSGIQVGIYNSAGASGLVGVQAGLWNEVGCFRGVQAGLVNTAGEARGLQVGLINRCETMYGYQVGLFNIIRDAELRFCPILNIGF